MRRSLRMIVLSTMVTLAACGEMPEAEGASAYDDEAEHGAAELASSKQSLTNPNLTNPGIVLNPGTVSVDPTGGVLTPGAATKTPCQKASNQFYRAQAAYLAAADALSACGYSFEPQCKAQADAFFAADSVLTAAYAKFLQECD